jgi:hypothetical protein
MKGLSFEMRLLLSGGQRQTRSPRRFFDAGRGQDLPGEIWEFLGRVSSTISEFRFGLGQGCVVFEMPD